MKRCALILVLLTWASASFAVWPPAIRLTDGPNENINPDAYVQEQPTPTGPLVVVWQRSRLGGWDIYSRENRYGLSWRPPVIVSSLPDSNLTPTIAAYFNYKYCAWVNCHGDSQNILCSRMGRTDSTWGPAMYVTQDSFPNLEPSVWCSEYRDSAAVAWVSLRNGRWNLYTRFYNGTFWSPVIPLVTDSGNNRCPRFFRVNFVYTYLTWQSDVRGNWDIYTSRYSGGSWSAPQRITNGSQADVQPSPVKGVNGGRDLVDLLWTSDSLGNWEVFGTSCSSIPLPTPERFTSHDSSDSEPSALMYMLPSFGKALYHPLLTAWTSRRDGNSNIYAENMNLTEVVDTNRAEDSHPTVSTTPGYKGKGNWIYNWVIWQSNRDGNWNLYGSYKMDWNGGVESGEAASASGSGSKFLSACPFRPPGTIALFLPESHSGLVLKLYDLQGRLLFERRPGSSTPGKYEVRWDGRDDSGKSLSSGLYFLKPEGTSALFRIVLLR